MNRKELVAQIRSKKSCLCVGLDSELQRLPDFFERKPASALEFNKAIIDATRDHCVAYKINTAFYERMGAAGWEVMEKTAAYIPDTHFKIADAKRGDIGNTSLQYAKAFFENLPFDAMTISPYMGRDSVEHFLEFRDKWAIVLALTSNPGSNDFEQQKIGDESLWQRVLRTISAMGSSENIMFVIGATKPEAFKEVRKIVPGHFLLVPGVGTQGGNLSEVILNGKNDDAGLLINVSRAIIFADNGKDFAKAAADKAAYYHNEMKPYL